MNSPIPSIQKVQEELEKLSLEKSFSQAQRVMFSVIALLDPTVADKDPESVFQLFTDSDGKIRANAGWFFEDKMIADRKAVYKIHGENALGIDFKAYGVSKASKRIVSWATGVTPNFEDEAFNGKFNVGIDFVVPKSCDRVIVVLTNNYVVRTLELKGKLTATYQEILAKWASINDFSNKKAFHSILWESFDLQPLNKKFYAGISERFILLRQHLEKEGIFDQKHASYFSNRLMGRVIFCWFLDHKNVLNAEKKYFDAKAYPSSTDYYRGRLETLFYRVLNTPVGDREPMVQDDVTPFLNGGLFEPRATDLFENPKLTFPKNYFDDLFEFLSGYNFTTDESTSQFQQVAIDPEMLGRIFENLLAEMTEETGEQARKAKGAFYTPREIVDYMCRESLREYLKTKIAEDEFRDQRLEQLIDRPDKEFQDQDHNWRRDWKPYKDVIIKALDELTVLDPACGSGAFPIGMLQLLVQVYERLESRFDSYRTKLQIIEKNLYGVDIEPMAVEIARLRAWLSIIVDEDADSKKIKPLPNLEFKFICANSLIDLDHNSETPLGGKDHNALAEELRTIRDAYFNTESLNKKKSLREKYNKLINEQEGLFGESKRSKQLKTYRPFDNEWSAGFFNPEFMFGVEKFDVVIGNPPYLRVQGIQKNHPTLVKVYKENYLSATGSFDLYVLFVEKGFTLIDEKGLINYIMPDKWLNSSFGKGLRNFISDNGSIDKIVTFKENQIFNASTYSSLVWFSKKRPGIILFSEFGGNETIASINEKLTGLQSGIHWSSASASIFSKDKWVFVDGVVQKVLEKVTSQNKKISQVFSAVYQGIATGKDEAFFLDRRGGVSDGLVRVYCKAKDKEYSLEQDLIKPLLKGNNVHKYEPLSTDKVVVFPYQYNANKEIGDCRVKLISQATLKEDCPHTWAYLKEFEKDLRGRENNLFDNDSWYQFSRSQGIFYPNKVKLVAPYLSYGSQYSFDKTGEYFTNTKCYSYIKNKEFEYSYYSLLGILNSNLLWFFIKHTSSVMRGGYRVYSPEYLRSFSFPEKSGSFEDIERLVGNRLEAKSQNEVKSLEKEINQIVYQLYGLTDEEIKIVENN